MSDLSIEPVVGWRVWGLALDRSDRPLLTPAGAGWGRWPGRRAFRAACRARGRHPTDVPVGQRHASPELGCSCGIYASSTLRTLMTSSPAFPLVSVVGTVSMWGRVIEHERGWRAEFAYPSRLSLVCGECLRAGAGTGKASFIVRRADPAGSPVVAMCVDHVSQVTRPGSRTLTHADEMRALLLDRYAVDLMPFDTVRCLFEREPVPGPVPYRRPPAMVPRQPPAASPVTHAGSLSRPTPPTLAATARGAAGTIAVDDRLVWRIARGLSQVASFLLGLAFVAVMCVATLQSCIVTVEASGRPARSPARREAVTDPSRPAAERGGIARTGASVPVPKWEVVCGRPHGGWIELVGCARGLLLGFADAPPRRCIDGTVAITRRPWFSICWISIGPIDVDPHAVAVNPFARGPGER